MIRLNKDKMEENKFKNNPIEIYPTNRNKVEEPIEIQETLNDTIPYITKAKKVEVPEDVADSFTMDLSEFKEEPVETKKPKPTYSQDWQAYDKAKCNEDGLFKGLLHELISACIEEPIKKAGRKGYTRKEKICFMCIKVFYKSDLRKAVSILDELKNSKYIDRVPSFKSIDNFFNDPSLSEVLDDLILISALPLANLEETGAIDSTGFSISKFERWFDYKWGKLEGKKRVWRKAHVAMGCKSNIFLSVKVTEKSVGDASMLEEVLGVKTKYFKMNQFVADKAYLSRKIITYLANLGLDAYIPFKSNSIRKSRGCHLWSKMFKVFNYNNKSYMKKYHSRSNIETGFWMVKQNYGDHLFTKYFTANVNEIKTKFLCQNIVSLIQEAFESNIKVDFESCVKIAHSV